MSIDIIAELRKLRPMHGGAMWNEITELGERIRAEQIAAAGATPDPPPVIDGVPVNAVLPVIDQGGSIISCTTGTWQSVKPISYSYRWKRDGSNAGAGNSYAVRASDVGHTFQCIVTASNTFGGADATSNSLVAVP